MVDIDSTIQPPKVRCGHRPGAPKTGGRKKGTPNNLTRQALLDLQMAGGDPPHLALLKIGREEKYPLAIRVSALGFCAPYFQPD
jgi:hypothetical protein